MLNESPAVPTKTRKTRQLPCVCAAGLGERNPGNCACRDGLKGASPIRAVVDGNGRWLVHWREKNGDEWVGTYRLLPC